MSAVTIYNLVRALTKPYVGAHCIYKNKEIKIWKVEGAILSIDKNIEFGKVLESADGMVTVQCGDNAVKILQHDFPDIPLVGEYL